ncbi:MAG: TPM domain-containing protein [Fusobacteriaceae bacterium]|nr:TPM domain-containing protein [Fusobacteriaceae bacterium]MBN2838684.1 TPM domain-containing protein [Fusobacteriaceae bacterium]
MKKILSLMICLLLSLTIYGKDYPNYKGFINDYANILDSQTENQLETWSKELQQKTTAEIGILTVDSLDGEDIESYANNVFRKWGIGNKEKNNGILFVVSKGDRKVRIEVGYGLEGVINDGKAGDILDNYVVPYYRDNNFGEGTVEGYKAIYSEIAKEYNIESEVSPKQLAQKQTEEKSGGGSNIFFFLIVGIIIIIMNIIFPNSRGGRGGGSSWGGGSSGGSSFGGGSSGGGGSSRGF